MTALTSITTSQATMRYTTMRDSIDDMYVTLSVINAIAPDVGVPNDLLDKVLTVVQVNY